MLTIFVIGKSELGLSATLEEELMIFREGKWALRIGKHPT